MWAAWNDRLAIASKLIESGASVDMIDKVRFYSARGVVSDVIQHPGSYLFSTSSTTVAV